MAKKNLSIPEDPVFHLKGFDYHAYSEHNGMLYEMLDAAIDDKADGNYENASGVTKMVLSLNPSDASIKYQALLIAAEMSLCFEDDEEQAVALLKDALTLGEFVIDTLPLATGRILWDKEIINERIAYTPKVRDLTLKHFKEYGVALPQTVFSKKVNHSIDITFDFGQDFSTDFCDVYFLLGLAENGDRYSQEFLSCCYFEGWGLQKNIPKGLYWLEKSLTTGTGPQFNPGYTDGFYLMGENYRQGITVDKDLKKAIAWYEKGAKENHTRSIVALAKLYFQGQDVKKDLKKSVELYTKAAELGDADAENALGTFYYWGDGVKQDFSKAFSWWTKAADDGNTLGISNLGELYRDGLGVKQDTARAVKLFKKSADCGDPWGTTNLGRCYLEGTGVKQDPKKGFELLKTASDLGDAGAVPCDDAQYWIGYCYFNGLGITKSKVKARQWMEKALQADNHNALVFVESHPELNLGNISGPISATYHISGSLIQDNHGIIASDNGVVNRSTASGKSNTGTFCPECGKSIDDDSRFCKYCGRKLR